MTKSKCGSASLSAMICGLVVASLLVVLSITMNHAIGALAYLWYAVLGMELAAVILGVRGWSTAFGKIGTSGSSLALLALAVL